MNSSQALTCTSFSTPGGSNCSSMVGFGGSPSSRPIHFNTTGGQGASVAGALERTPHNGVHSGAGLWMAEPNCAALDPIFYLHHANIDRLWKRWLAQGGGRQDPTSDQAWMTRVMFPFFDENGQEVQQSGRDILNTVDQLDYCYDDDPGG